MERKNSILLTVIAIATLLAAVVGATFAYFTANIQNTANVNSKVEIKERDMFTATSTGSISMEITNAMMQNVSSSTAVQTKTATITVKLEAGSGKATCSYKLKLVNNASTSGTDTYAKTSSSYPLEYTFQGTDNSDTTQTFAEINADTAIANGTLGTYVIEHTAGDEVEEQTWTITNKFYNLPIDQSTAQSAKKYDYSVVVDNSSINCTNAA